MSNYVIYPFKNMRITQTYNGGTSHKPHTTGNLKDYPIDEGGKDTGREAVYCPCDEIKIKRVYGVGSSGVNTVFFESTAKCNFADGTTDYLCGLITHSNDSDIKDLKVGQTFKRKEIICYEGTDGGVGMHAHISFGKGILKGNGWVKNSNGKYVLNASNGAFKPEQICYVDKAFTKVLNTNGLSFKDLPKEPAYKSFTGYVNVDAISALNVRSGPGTDTAKLGSLTRNAAVVVIGESGSWYKIKFNGKTAYVSKQYISKTKLVVSKYYKKYSGKSTNIDVIFEAVGVPASYRGKWSKRIPVAKANGIKAYIGTASQNTKLIALAKQGKLMKP